MNHDPDQQPDGTDEDVDGHLFIPPEERGGGHPTGTNPPRKGRSEEPRA